MGELARIYDTILEAAPKVRALHGVHLDEPEARAVRDEFYQEIRTLLEQRMSALAITMCISAKRLEPLGDWGVEHVISALTIDGVSPIAYAVETTEEESTVIRFGTVPVNRAGEQLLAAIEEADTAFGDATYHG